MNRARKICVEGWQDYLQFASPDNIAGQMKNDLGLHGLKQLAYRGDVAEIGLPPSKMLAVRAVQLPRNCMYPGVASQESVAKVRTDEAAAACHQHWTPRNSIRQLHRFHKPSTCSHEIKLRWVSASLTQPL